MQKLKAIEVGSVLHEQVRELVHILGERELNVLLLFLPDECYCERAHSGVCCLTLFKRVHRAWILAKTNHKGALGKNKGKTPNLATPATTELRHACIIKLPSMTVKSKEGKSTTSGSASMINTASSFDHLRELFEKVSDDQGWKSLTILGKLWVCWVILQTFGPII